MHAALAGWRLVETSWQKETFLGKATASRALELMRPPAYVYDNDDEMIKEMMCDERQAERMTCRFRLRTTLT